MKQKNRLLIFSIISAMVLSFFAYDYEIIYAESVLEEEYETGTNTDASYEDDVTQEDEDTDDNSLTEDVDADIEVDDETDADISKNEYIYSYIDEGERFGYYEEPIRLYTSNSANQSNLIPSSYDARDYGYITSVKDQNPDGTCWAFATLGAGESYLVKKGLYNNTSIDLSELQLAYFTFNNVDDPLGLISNDNTTILDDSTYRNVGFNEWFSLFTLASWLGAGDEADVPYEFSSDDLELDDDYAYDNDIAHLQNAYVVSTENPNQVKKLIMEYGAVSSSIYMDKYYLNEATMGYFQKYTNATDHAIMIIGWDDNFAVSNFKDGNNKPSSPGAWLIKNSWGEGNYDYFWASYEDAALVKNDVFVFDFEDDDNYDFNYQYDGTYGTKSLKLPNGSSLANVFTVAGADKEEIDAVAFAFAEDNVRYSIQIYLNPEQGNPMSGTPMLSTPKTGTTQYTGYYTIELDESIDVEYGDSFSVVVTVYDDNDDGYVYFFVDSDRTVNSKVNNNDIIPKISFDSYSESGQSYYINGSSIQDLSEMYEDDSCARIKAFTTYDSRISIKECEVESISDQLFTGLDVKPAPEIKYESNILTKNVDYTIAYSDNRSMGTATITIRGIGNYKGTKIITFEIVGIDINDCTVSTISDQVYTGSAIKPAPVIKYGSTKLVSGTDYTVSYSNNKNVGTATVTITGKGKYYGSRKITFKIKAINLSSCTVAAISDQVYTGSAIKPTPVIKYGSTKLVSGTDFTVSYKNNKAFGTATVTITGKGKYTGTKKVTFNIIAAKTYTKVYNGFDYSAVYDYNYYVKKYPDIWKAYGTDTTKTLAHFVNYGMKAGRQGSDEFNVTYYKNRYADLRKAYGADLTKYYLHYINYGKKAGRDAKTYSDVKGAVTVYNGVDYSAVYNYNYYINKYADIKKAYGNDDAAVLKHFVTYGMKGGRQGSAEFNVTNYKNRYGDLRKAYGSDLTKYYMHYIKYGKKAGRNGK